MKSVQQSSTCLALQTFLKADVSERLATRLYVEVGGNLGVRFPTLVLVCSFGVWALFTLGPEHPQGRAGNIED